jgi:DNA invertase Pin-like site-specific DNA recombinase
MEMKSQSVTTSLPRDLSGVRPAAIYGRVSTDTQENEGSSLDTQRASCLQYCEGHHYTVTHQFIETWTGLSLERPQLDALRQLVRNEDISVVVVHSLDRLSRDPTHGVILTQELEKHHVVLEAVTEDVDNSELGKLINYIKGYAAKLEAEKIRERTQRGIKSRVFGDRLPVTFRAPLGYSWDKTGDHPKLRPNDDYETVKLILNLAIEGHSYDYIIAELKRRVTPSPGGLDEWNKHSISAIIHNPVYCGKFYAFKSEVATPKKRNGSSYGKSSVKRLSPDQWHYIPEIVVERPPITSEQREFLLNQLQKRIKLSSRNANRNYLLRGLVNCETHRGKGGEPRRYHGIPKHGSYYYACPIGGCAAPYIDGPSLDFLVTYSLYMQLITCNDEDFEGLFSGEVDGIMSKNPERPIHLELQRLEHELGEILRKQAKLEDERLAGRYDGDDAGIYANLAEQYAERREKIKARQNELLQQLAALEHKELAIKSLKDIREKFVDGLHTYLMAYAPKESASYFGYKYLPNVPTDTMQRAFEIWRDIFQLLDFSVHIYAPDAEGSEAVPIQIGTKTIYLAFCANVPLPRLETDDIASADIEPG